MDDDDDVILFIAYITAVLVNQYHQDPIPTMFSVASSFVRTTAVRSMARSSVARTQFAFFSDESHDDFAAKRKVVDGADEAMQMIKVCVECCIVRIPCP
jgi:hypothetical protein